MSDSEFTTQPCTKARAIYELCRAAFYSPSEDGCEDRCLTHSFLGPVGADWDVAPAIALIDRAESVMWNLYGTAGHEMEVVVADPDKKRRYYFDVKMPRAETNS